MNNLSLLRAASIAGLILSVHGLPLLAQVTGSEFKDCPRCSEMLVIPSGRFTMGSDPDPLGDVPLESDEEPQRTVSVRSFALGKYEVTQDEWFAIMGTRPSKIKGGMLPVERVSWDDVQKFLQKLNVKTGKNYRLPTEAEWEYAARAGSTTAYSFGDDVSQLVRYAWSSVNSERKTHPVGAKLPNGFGLYDMHGNVWEWVQDCYKDSYVGAPVDGGAAAEQADCLRVFRGGSWFGGPETLLSSLRNRSYPDLRVNDLGFRIAIALK